jgi:putative endonuclease
MTHMDGGSIPPISTRLIIKSPKRGFYYSLVASHLKFITKKVECPELVEGLVCYNSIMYFVYMIKDNTNNLYIGLTDNPERRLYEHNSGRGALFTKNTSHFKIVFLEEYKTLIEARKREIQLKKWRREKKEILIEKYNNGLKTNM